MLRILLQYCGTDGISEIFFVSLRIINRQTGMILVQDSNLTVTEPYLATIFCPENVFCCFMSATYIKVHFRLDFFKAANNMNPDQTAPSDLDSFCLEYRLPKNISR